MNTEEQRSSKNLNCLSATSELSSPEEEESPNVKKVKVDSDTRNSPATKETVTTNGTSLYLKNTRCAADPMDDDKTDTDSEPEEGEITDSEQEEYSSEDDVMSEETINSEDTDSEGEFFLLTNICSSGDHKKYEGKNKNRNQVLNILDLKISYLH